jgi:sialate O-acetylesterase
MKSKRTLIGILTTCLSLCVYASLPFVHPVISDNAVLQRDVALPVWGWTEAGSKIQVSLLDVLSGKEISETATADNTGRWEVKLPAHNAGGSYEITVTGTETQKVSNLIFGDIWLCSGQSNMQQGILRTNKGAEAVKSSENPNIRILRIPGKIYLDKQKTFASSWEKVNKSTLSSPGWSGFTAVGYYFGRQLNQDLDIPIGLIQSAWGGTIIETWIGEAYLEKIPEIQKTVESTIKKIDNQLAIKNYSFTSCLEKWISANVTKGIQPTSLKLSETKMLPATWKKLGIKNFDGVVMVQKTFELPENLKNKDLILYLNKIDDLDITYINNIQIGQTLTPNSSRKYKIKKELLNSGKNAITIIVVDKAHLGGFNSTGKTLFIADANDASNRLNLDGEWNFEVIAKINELPDFPVNMTASPNKPTLLYKSMICPLFPMAIKGAIWYQGESNAGQPEVYKKLLPALIADWRANFTTPDKDFPFGIVQLANFMKPTDLAIEKSGSSWAGLREAQLLTSQKVPNTGLAVICDIGDTTDIHPRNKDDVGKRLALWAEATVYDKDIVYSGPIYKDMKRKGNKAIVSFDHIGGGLVSKDNTPLKHFAVAGTNKIFYIADAIIKEHTIIVSSPDVKEPIAIRYAWKNNPANLNFYNKDGLPASPFRTDK